MAEPKTNLRMITPRSPARDIQDQIRGMEQGLDDALADGGELIAKILRAGRVAGLHAAQVQRPVDRLIQGMAAGAQMRALVNGTHQDLRHLARKIDLPELGWGDMGDSPDWPKAAPDADPVPGVATAV